MISTNIRAIRYQGNASTTQPYAITFPFLRDAGNIRVRIIPDGGTATDLDASAYVVHDPEGAAPYVTTQTAYPSTTEVIVFRWVPFTQPLDLPEGGRFPSESMEDALDRLTMLTMQIGDMQVAGIEPGITVPAEGLQDVPTWANDAARATVKPARTGQLAFQRDNRGIYFARSTNVGDWQLWTGPITGQRLVIGLTADQGVPDANATAVAARLAEWNCDAVIFGGDNRYDPHTFAAAWAPFSAFITSQKALAALGNHDTSDWAAHASQFAYNGGNGRYFRRSLGNGLLDIFVLHSGRDSAWNVIEPDGNTVGSVQHQWFVAQLALSTARWKMVVLHHPPVTSCADANRADTNLDWPEFAQVDALICGHVHLSEWLTCRGVPVINVSGGVLTDRSPSPTLAIAGVAPAQSDLLWVEDDRRLVGRMEVTPQAIRVAYHDIFTGALCYQRTVADQTQHRGQWGDAIGEAADTFPAGDGFGLGKCPANIRNPIAIVQGRLSAAGSVTVLLYVDGVNIGTATLTSAGAGNTHDLMSLSRGIRRGAVIELAVDSVPPYVTMSGPFGVTFAGAYCS